MGISVPGAIGARLVYPDKKILAICGDGGFMMNCQEFETALRAKNSVCHPDLQRFQLWTDQVETDGSVP